MNQKTSRVRSGYTILATCKDPTLVIPQVVYDMLFFLFESAGMQKDIYTFQLTTFGGPVKSVNMRYMHFGATTENGWRVQMRYGGGEIATATGIFTLPEGISKESLSVKLTRVLGELNYTGWKDFSPSITTKEMLSSTSFVPDINLARILEIKVRTREMCTVLNQFQAEFDAYKRHGTCIDMARIDEILSRLQQIEKEVQVLKVEQDTYKSRLCGLSKEQLIKQLFG